MSLSVFYLIIMWLWFIGAEIWIFTAMRTENNRYLAVAAIYGLVMLVYGGMALMYEARGQ